MNKVRKKLITILIIILLISVPTGCADDPGQTMSAEQLAILVRENAFEDADFIFTPPLHGVAQTQTLEFYINFDPSEKGFDDLSQIMNVYLDSDFTISANPIVEYDVEKGMLIISPSSPKPLLREFSPYGARFWGFSKQYYAVRYYDDDGEKLSTPIVTIFTIENELEAPLVSFSVSNGFPTFSWNPVPGAEEYHVFSISKRPHLIYDGYRYFAFCMICTSETEHTFGEKSRTDHNLIAYNASWRLREIEEYYFIAVVAVNENGVSQLSNAFHSNEIMSMLPLQISINNTESLIVDTVNDLDVFQWIEMCDGSLIRMPINYHIDEIEIVEFCGTLGMRISYTVQGIGMEGFYIIRDFECPEFEQDLLRLKEREIDVHRAGMLTPSIERVTGDKIVPDYDILLYIDKFYVNAPGPLSEFLAINMLNGVEYVDFRAFPEAFDFEYLIAAWHEALYQNPLILNVNGIRWSADGDLFIDYGQTREEQQRKQTAIMTEVRRIVNRIITDYMTDFEKKLAINNYLVETTEFDFEALEYAKQRDFAYVDSQFYDSFTAYGVLINKTGVSSGYAAAFKLLADEAGLSSVVVTGHLFGFIPHAWNRVLVDGEWMTLDVPNTFNEAMNYSFFNLPDYIAKTIFVE